MQVPEYISIAEVQRVCKALGLRDWTALDDTLVTEEEAAIIQKLVGAEAGQISTSRFKMGLEVELEHGLAFPDANVTNNHPILTGKIVLAHLKETLDYYERLLVAELEGDLLKAIASADLDKAKRKYTLLLEARAAQNAIELDSFTLRP